MAGFGQNATLSTCRNSFFALLPKGQACVARSSLGRTRGSAWNKRLTSCVCRRRRRPDLQTNSSVCPSAGHEHWHGDGTYPLQTTYMSRQCLNADGRPLETCWVCRRRASVLRNIHEACAVFLLVSVRHMAGALPVFSLNALLKEGRLSKPIRYAICVKSSSVSRSKRHAALARKLDT